MPTEAGEFGPETAITRLRRADLPALEQLLRDHGLPAADCGEQLDHFHAIYRGDQLAAAGALEPAGDAALLRSIVVAPGARGRGLGAKMTRHLLACARNDGYRAVYLLTETAAQYFVRFDFVPTERAEVPAAVAATRQFESLCPDSATCLVLRLDSR